MSIFFSLKHFFISLTISTQVASAPLSGGAAPWGASALMGERGGGGDFKKNLGMVVVARPPPPSPPTHPTMGNPALTKGGVEPSNNWGTWRVCSNFFAKKGWGKSERRVDSFFYCFSSNKILKRLISHILPIVKTLTTST